MALVNARMSDRSYRRWSKRSGVARSLFSRFTVVAAQNPMLAQRFASLGARDCIPTGNLKIDSPPLPVNETLRRDLEAALTGRPRLVAASTHAGEEQAVAEAHRRVKQTVPGLCTVIAPRHPERGAGIAASLTAQGFQVRQRSAGLLPDVATDIYIADTIGELGTLYAIAPIAFIGGSLIPHGGQNPIEAVRHGAAIVTGPHWHNFPDAYRALIEGNGAIEVIDWEGLAGAVAHLLADQPSLTTLQGNAGKALDDLSGALDRTVACLLPLLPAAQRSLAGAR